MLPGIICASVSLCFPFVICFPLSACRRVVSIPVTCQTCGAALTLFRPLLLTTVRSLGLNLTGADTVIFYDSDWNPAMDAQAQDRCHRIGQTREVHIYRLISEYTIEENILKKAMQKRVLDQLVTKEGAPSHTQSPSLKIVL